MFVLHIFTCLCASWSFSGSGRRKKSDIKKCLVFVGNSHGNFSLQVFSPFILLFCIHGQLSIVELVIIVRWSLNTTCTWVFIGLLQSSRELLWSYRISSASWKGKLCLCKIIFTFVIAKKPTVSWLTKSPGRRFADIFLMQPPKSCSSEGFVVTDLGWACLTSEM